MLKKRSTGLTASKEKQELDKEKESSQNDEQSQESHETKSDVEVIESKQRASTDNESGDNNGEQEYEQSLERVFGGFTRVFGGRGFPVGPAGEITRFGKFGHQAAGKEVGINYVRKRRR